MATTRWGLKKGAPPLFSSAATRHKVRRSLAAARHPPPISQPRPWPVAVRRAGARGHGRRLQSPDSESPALLLQKPRRGRRPADSARVRRGTREIPSIQPPTKRSGLHQGDNKQQICFLKTPRPEHTLDSEDSVPPHCRAVEGRRRAIEYPLTRC